MKAGYSFGNLYVERVDATTEASEDTGLYLLSQPVPFNGTVARVRACGLLLAKDTKSILEQVNYITMFAFVAIYRQVGSTENYIRRYIPYLLHYIVSRSERFGCGVNDLTALGWNVSRGDRVGVLVPHTTCFHFSDNSSTVMAACPAHVNLIDPVKNCSQAYFFRGSSLPTSSEVPEKLTLRDGYPQNVFINLEITIGKWLMSKWLPNSSDSYRQS